MESRTPRSESMEFTQLSDELLILILVHLDVSSLTQCRQVSSVRARSMNLKAHNECLLAFPGQVCHRIAEIVNYSALLKYQIELAVAGMEDGCPDENGPSTADRRQALEAYCDSWRALEFSEEIDLTTRHEICYTTSDGHVVVCVRTTNVLEVIQFPSRSRNPEGDLRTWTIAGADIADADIADAEIDIGICAVDSSQDLLVVVEQCEPGLA